MNAIIELLSNVPWMSCDRYLFLVLNAKPHVRHEAETVVPFVEQKILHARFEA
jgi:hypothetical protein